MYSRTAYAFHVSHLVVFPLFIHPNLKSIYFRTAVVLTPEAVRLDSPVYSIARLALNSTPENELRNVRAPWWQSFLSHEALPALGAKRRWQ